MQAGARQPAEQEGRTAAAPTTLVSTGPNAAAPIHPHWTLRTAFNARAAGL